MTTTYCTPENVRRVLKLPVKFDENTNPDKDEVDEIINAFEDHIDEVTRHAWRTITVTDEYHDLPFRNYRNRGYYYGGPGLRVGLSHRKIKTFSSSDGDKLEIWNGEDWEDWIVSKTEGRADDFWVDYTSGTMYLKTWYFYNRPISVRVTYRYGETTVPGYIKRACAYFAASEIVTSDDDTMPASDTGDTVRMSNESKSDKWQRRADRLIVNRKEFFSIEV